MIYEPSYCVPYLNAVDSDLDNYFQCTINADGGTPITKYKLNIYTMDGYLVYTSGEVQLDIPIYNKDVLKILVNSTNNTLSDKYMQNGDDYTWEILVYEQNPTMWVTYGTVQEDTSTTTIKIRSHFNVEVGMYMKIKNETKKILSYDEKEGTVTLDSAFSFGVSKDQEYNIYSNFIRSNNIYFKARTTPVVTIENMPTDTFVLDEELEIELPELTTRSYKFIGKYVQAELVPWKYFSWIILDSEDDIVKQVENQNTGTIEFEFDGFVNNTIYKIQLTVENQDGTIKSTSLLEFYINYEPPEILIKPTATNNCSKNSVILSWTPPFVNHGVATGEYELVKDVPFDGASSVHIFEESTIYYYPSTTVGRFQIPYNNTTFIYCKLYREGPIIDFINEDTGDYYMVWYNEEGHAIYYDINGVYSGKYPIKGMNDWYKITLLPTRVLVGVVTEMNLN